MCLKLFTRFSTCKRPKRPIKNVCSVLYLFDWRECWEGSEFFRDRNHLFDTDIRWWINFQEIQIQMRRHCEYNRLHWEGYCDQQSYRFLKLTPLLHVSLVTRRSSLVVVVFKMCVASWSGWVRTALFRALRLSRRVTFWGKRLATP